MAKTSKRTNPQSPPAGDSSARAGRIVPAPPHPVKPETPTAESPRRGRRPGRPKTRRQSHGSAWHWRQTDCWYYTLPGTKKRIPLLDEVGVRVRGKDNKEQARLALARVKLVEQGELAPAPAAGGEWLVARVCSEYIQYCDRGVTNRAISADHRAAATAHLNDLCQFCGARKRSVPSGTGRRRTRCVFNVHPGRMAALRSIPLRCGWPGSAEFTCLEPTELGPRASRGCCPETTART